MKFTKAVASGNDFIIVDNRTGALREARDLSAFAKDICRRRLSVGADGLLVLEDSDQADLRMRIFNPDGSEVAMCGNGIRCMAIYTRKKNWRGEGVKIETLAGIVSAQVKDDLVKTMMTEPKDVKLGLNLGIGNTVIEVHFINTGVPHAVHFTEDVRKYPVKNIGEKIRYHKNFAPEGTNVDFISVLAEDKIEVRTYERGVEDETLACGTGVVASAIISHLARKTRVPTKVLTKSGDTLNVYFKSHGGHISQTFLEGSARIVYEGSVDYV